MPQVSANSIAQILDRIDIVQLVGEYVALRKAGVNYLGLCPFHNEKSPSFNVNPARRIFHCFGCQEGGDAIKFYMKIEGLSFPQALEKLADRVGVELPKEDWKSKKTKADKTHEQELLGLNRMALDFYREQLKGPKAEKAREYLLARAVDPAAWDKHQIGYAPEGWNELTYFLRNKRLPLPWAVEVGLLVAKEPDRHYDRFRDRIMFPVLSSAGEVLGFSGRTLQTEGNEAKYLNSPESVVFKKGEAFLGLALAKSAIRKAKYAVLVEGNFDYLSLHLKGIEEAVAPMGTALTPGQVRVLRRFASDSVILCYDADNAGQKASRRAIPLLLEGGLFPKVAKLPEKEDPDSFARKSTQETLQAFFRGAKDAVEAWIDEEDLKTKGDIPARARAAEEIFQVVQLVKDPAAQELYKKKLEGQFWVGLRTLAKAKQTPRPQEPKEEAPVEAPLPQSELSLVKLVFFHRNLRPEALRLGASKVVSHPGLKEALAQIEAADPDIPSENLLDSISDDGIKQALRGVLIQPQGTEEDPKKGEQSLKKTIYYLRDQEYHRQINQEIAQAKIATAAGNPERAITHALRIENLKKEQELLRRALAKVLAS